MGKSVVVIRHVHFEDLGILESLLQKLEFDITYIDAPTADFSKFNPLSAHLLVVLGAPIGAFDEKTYPFLTEEMTFINKRLQTKKPILGICLGAQLLARLLGAKVYPLKNKEIGFSRMSITAMSDNPLNALTDVPVLHWHGDQFDIPADCHSLAATELCPNQAFLYDNNIFALQFHLEANPYTIEQWLVGHACELYSANIDIACIRRDATIFGADLKAAGETVIRQWLNSIGLINGSEITASN